MTNKEFVFKYAGKEFMYCGDRVIVVGYHIADPVLVIISPVEKDSPRGYWERLGDMDAITYEVGVWSYWYANLNKLIPATEEKQQTVTEVKQLTPGECIAHYEGQQGMNYSVVNGCVSAVYKRQGSALKLVSRGDSINNVTEKI